MSHIEAYANSPINASVDTKTELRRERKVVISLFISTLMAAIDGTIVLLAIPTIVKDLNSTVDLGIWVILSYLITLTVLSSQVGKISDRYGRAKMYNLGIAIFTIFSALCALSVNIIMLIITRALQAVGGALISTNSSALVADNFEPNRRGRVFGLTSAGWNFGSILGIFLGGLLTTIDWHLIFLINLPIGIGLLSISLKAIRDVREKDTKRLDITGALLLGVALLCIVLFMTFFILFGIDGFTLTLVILAAIFTAAFILNEYRSDEPTIDFKIFNNRVVRYSILASTIQSIATFSVLFLIILYLQGPRDLNPLAASLYLLPGYIVGAIIAPYAGKLSDIKGAREIASIGLALIIGAYILYELLLSPSMNLYLLLLITFISGAGSGLFFPSNISAIMSNADKDKYGMTAGTNRMLGNIGTILSFVVSLTVASASISKEEVLAIFVGTLSGLNSSLVDAFVHAVKVAILVSIALLIVAIIFSLARGKERRSSNK
ncbi:MAG: MFS transporter [Candidatus Micrarchaeota archaeon]|nr:MAG: MFS transporter [Candidatus Micrarchaeota archaeon]